MNKICKLIYIDHLKQKHIVHHCLHYRTRNGTSHMKGRFSVPASSNERLQMGGLSGNQFRKANTRNTCTSSVSHTQLLLGQVNEVYLRTPFSYYCFFPHSRDHQLLILRLQINRQQSNFKSQVTSKLASHCLFVFPFHLT